MPRPMPSFLWDEYFTLNQLLTLFAHSSLRFFQACGDIELFQILAFTQKEKL